MKKSTKLVISGLATALLLSGCGNEKKDLPEISQVSFIQDDIDNTSNIASINVNAVIEKEKETFIRDNGNRVDFTTGDGKSGYFDLKKGRHKVKVCASNDDGEVCSDEKILLVSENLPLSAYTKYELKAASNAITNNSSNIIYGTVDGNIYKLDLDNQTSNLLSEVNERVSGLSYISENKYYYSSIDSFKIYTIDTSDKSSVEVASTQFPDGLDLYKNKIYAVTADSSGILSIFDLQGNEIRTIDTNIDDIVGISHTEEYLYILAEDGSIYQTNPTTGDTSKIFENNNLFDKSSSYNGLEAITVMNNKIYVSYVNDESVYLINIDLEDYE